MPPLLFSASGKAHVVVRSRRIRRQESLNGCSLEIYVCDEKEESLDDSGGDVQLGSSASTQSLFIYL